MNTAFVEHSGEDAPRESEELFQSIFDNAPMGVALVDKDGYVLAANEADCRFLGYSRDELVGTHFRTFTYSEDLNADSKLYDSLTRGERASYVIDKRYVRKDGRIVWGRLSASLIRDAEGRPKYAVILCEDITDRKQMEEQIKSLARFPSENPNPVLRIDKNGILITANDASKALLQKWSFGVGQVAPKFWHELVSEALSTGLSKNADVEFGGRFYSFLIKPTIEAGYVNLYGRDITERKKAEQALRESEERFRAILDGVNDGILVADLETRKFCLGNNAICRMLGYRPEDIKNLGVMDIHPRESLPHVMEQFDKLARQEIAVAADIPVKRRDGSIFHADISPSFLTLVGRTYLVGVFRDITERKKAEEALRLSELKYRTLFENLPHGVYQSSPQGAFLSANRALVRMLGYESQEELLALDISHGLYVNPEDRKAWIRRLEEEGVVRDVEIVVRRKDGGELTLLDNAHVVRDEQGRVLYYEGTLTDITERKRAERALRESEELYRHLIQRQGEGLAIVDLEERFTFCNPRGDEIFGVSTGGIVGRTTREFTTPEAFEFIKKQTEKRLAGKKATYELEILRPDGDKRHLLVTAAPWLDKDNHVIGSVAIFRDETDRKRAEEEIRKLNQFLASIIDNTNVWLDVLDDNANVVIWNKAAEVISGYSREEVAGHGRIWEWLYPDEKYRRQLTDLVADVVQRGRVDEDFETRIRRKDGEIRIISWNERNLLDEHGKAIGSIALGRDVTERKRMEEKLKEYSEHLEQLVEERTKKLQDAERLATIGQVAAMVGHDLRNPLQVLTNTLYLLEEGFKTQASSQMAELLEKKRPMLLETMEEQVGYMNKIVSDLQDYARPLKPELATTNLRRLMDEILSAAVVPESISVSVVIEENVRELTVDHTLMKRAFTNLVTNAVQAMPDGGRLSIRALKADKMALISIQDTGAGIPKENLDKVFTPMFSTKAKGQGFGLAACKRIVEAHGGSISFESGVGKGTAVFIKIPITDEVGYFGGEEKNPSRGR
jgi:PAS domain S-box-containing protein